MVTTVRQRAAHSKPRSQAAKRQTARVSVLVEHRPSRFQLATDTVTPHLNGTALTALSATRIRALAKRNGASLADLDLLVSSHRLAAKVGAPASVVFALSDRTAATDKTSLLSSDLSSLRKNIESAVKNNVVPRETINELESAKSVLASLQTHEAPIKTLLSTYGLRVSDSLVRKLAKKRISTLADLRSIGDTTAVAKMLNVKRDARGLETLVAHAHLSLLGTDVATNAVAIKRGYSRVSAIADAPEGVFTARIGPEIGFAKARQMNRTAVAQRALLQNSVANVRARQADGWDISQLSSSPPYVNWFGDQRCGCEDCSSAVSPLAYLADLIGYATTTLGVLKDGLAPIYRLFDPNTGDHFYTQSRLERDTAAGAGYRYEGIGFYLLSVNQDLTRPVYRLFHPATKDQNYVDDFYTTSLAEKNNAVANLGYLAVQTIGYIYDIAGNRSDRTKLYRLLNDTSHDHFYTQDPVERDNAISLGGYHKEGIESIGYVTTDPYSLLTPLGLEESFLQPFTDLPTSCRLMDERVRQVRICIEVLRRYLIAKSIRLPQSFVDKEARYRSDTYQSLLLALGVSYAALRASRGASQEDRETLAASLGIPLGDGNQRDYLSELLLDVDTVTESDLERIFGLADTTRDPLSHGAELDDTSSQVTRWNFDNVSWNVNTDIDGCVYANVSKPPYKTRIDVFRARNGTSDDLQASAEIASSETAFPLAATYVGRLTDGLTGELEIERAVVASNIKFQVVPQLVSWRLQTLRSQWQEQDWLIDAYSPLTPPEQQLPIVDPDLIGPDDFRAPFGTATTSFKRFWRKRRLWVDDLVDHFSGIIFGAGVTPQTPADDVFTTLFQDMRQSAYGGTTVTFWLATAEDQLPKLSLRLQDKTDKDKLKATTNQLGSNYKLTPEMLVRLLTLKKKQADRVYDSAANPALEQGEWTEVINILVEAHKSAWAAQWIKDENAQALPLGPEDFWISQSEPEEGDWPPNTLPAGVPRVDPQILKLDELPDAGALAILWWNARAEELQQFAESLSQLDRDLPGATNRIKAACPNRAIGDLEQRYDDLNGTDTQTINNATNYVENTLNWQVAPFKRVMELRNQLKSGPTPPPPKPSNIEWAEMEGLLTTAYKQYVAWQKWRKDEDDAGLEYWDMVKAQLPRWRASIETRLAWQQALRARSAPAIIDPDLLRETHFRARRINPAQDLWRARGARITAMLGNFIPSTKTKNGLETLLNDGLGPFATDGLSADEDGLHVLLRDALDKNVTDERLDQIGITRAALDFLTRMYGLLSTTPPQKLTDQEWNAIAAILTQVLKMRQTAVWRDEERAKGVTQSPDWFKIPVFASTTEFPPPSPPDPPTWRGTRSDVQDWEDQLQSRIDQESTTVNAVQQVVSDVEEMTLPDLRDALVMICGKGVDLSARADWITERLLIDAKQGGCERTTRIAQAIETIQQLLWGVRTGLLTDAYPNIKLVPVRMKEEAAIEEFDEAMIWLGSLGSYRGAVFVFLYPENILLPSLKRHQTPAFRQLSEDFRNTSQMTPARFSAALTRFYSYFDDVCDLTLAVCQATIANVYEENELGDGIGASPIAKPVEYLFATTSRGSLYWSVAGNSDADWGQTYWRPLSGFKNDLVSLIGCAVFKTSTPRRLLYLFAKTTKDGEDKIEFLRLDLERGGWDADAAEISLVTDADQQSFDVRLVPRGQSTTAEAIAPALLIHYPDGSEYLYTLGQKGDTDKSTTQTLGAVTNWTGRLSADTLNARPIAERHIEFSPSTDPQYWHKYVSATSLCVCRVGGVTTVLAYWAQHESRIYSGRDDQWYPLGWAITSMTRRFCLAGTLSNNAIAWGGTVSLEPAPTPSSDLNNIWPVGFATADIDHDGNPDLVWCYLKKISTDSNNKILNVYYTVGGNVGTNGIPTTPGTTEFFAGISLTDPILGLVKNDPNDQKGGTDITENGLKVTIATLPNTNRNFLVVAAASRSNPKQARLFSVEIGSTGYPVGPAITLNGPTSSVDGTPTGIGLAFTSLRNNDQVDAVVFYLMRPVTGGETVGEYFVNPSWSPDNPQENWSEAQKVGANVDPKTSDTWFGGLTGGAAIAVADVDGNGRQDLIVFHDGYGNGPTVMGQGGVDGFYRIGFDFAFQNVGQLSQCQHDSFKPFSGMVPLEFLGYRPAPLLVTERALNSQQANLRNFVYLEEAFYFTPVLSALQLQTAHEFIASLDWFRVVYDYTLAFNQRQLIGLAPPKTTNAQDFQRDDPQVSGDEYDWLLDPLNPHAIAQTRKNTYSRYTRISIVKCLLDYADTEYTTDTSESVPRARGLYMTAVALLHENELKPISETCEGVRGDLEIVFGEQRADYLTDLLPNEFHNFDDARRLRDSLTKVFARYGDSPNFLAKARTAIADLETMPTPAERLGVALARADADTLQLESASLTDERLVSGLENIVTRFSFMTSAPALLGPSGDPYPDPPDGGGPFPEGDGGLGHRPTSIGDPTQSVPYKPPMNYGPGVAGPTSLVDPAVWLKVLHFCVPQNPVLRMLRLRANLNLYKIRTCRNISGLKRELDPYAAPTDTTSGLPSMGAGGQLVLPGITSLRPTPYPYPTLIDRAKQLAQLAMQIEQAFLAALEKSDAESYALLKAKQDLNLSTAGVRLQDLRVTEAQGGIRLATLQRDRAKIQMDTYQQWMSAGLSQLEQAIIGLYIASGVAQAAAGVADAVLQGLAAPAGGEYAAAVAGAARAAQAALDTTIKVSEIYASQERRMQEWQLQNALAMQDYAIGDQQIDIAQDHVRVTEQERTIAQMQNDNARAVVDFLAGKFTNKELYDWMSSVLERVYSFFLQQATAMAQLAQNQLGFERQETPPSYIQSDYWISQSGSGNTDRRGLTGSARLLQDIYQLDQYSFDTKKRKLQLSKTLSLAQLAPFEFQHFRETGVLTFATPMELFDRDFPGHYLRLIKRVRTSVLALIPPTQGIRATLSSTGLSRVVVGGDIYQTANLRRDPETIALSSPINATGLFDLESQQPTDMLLFMENTGVDTQWEFRMLKASNQFDYETIADVLLTIEYTALNSFDYYAQVIQSPALNRPLSADRPYSFRQDLADGWYDLHHADESETPMVVRFETAREDFPPNLANIKIQHVLLYVASTTDNLIEIADVELHFTDGGGGRVGGYASTNDGVISTRRGNAGAWTAMIGKAPFGNWELSLPNNESVRALFKEPPTFPQRPADRVADLLLVVTYSGRTPAWPL